MPDVGTQLIEPANLFVVTYYATNAEGEAPASISLLMRDYNSAVEQAKTFISDAGNIGVCTIQLVTATIVYPFVPWEAF